jgi:hypothetical protein
VLVELRPSRPRAHLQTSKPKEDHMHFDEFFDRIREWIEDTGWAFWVGVVLVILCVGIPLWLLWPTIQPKPKPAQQSLSSLASTIPPDLTGASPIPEELRQEIMADVGVKDEKRVSMSWSGNQKEIIVSVATGPTQFKRYVYIQREGTWERK